jgi:hypothetical protein
VVDPRGATGLWKGFHSTVVRDEGPMVTRSAGAQATHSSKPLEKQSQESKLLLVFLTLYQNNMVGLGAGNTINLATFCEFILLPEILEIHLSEQLIEKHTVQFKMT